MAAPLTIDQILQGTEKSAGDVTSWASNVMGHSRSQGDNETRFFDKKSAQQAFSLTGQSLTNIQQQLNVSRNQVASLANIVNNITGLTIAELVAAGFGRQLKYQVVLSAGVNNITYADPLYETDTLDIWIRQNGTGNGTITFDTNLKMADPYFVTNTANAVTIYPFSAFPDPTDSNALHWFCRAVPNAEKAI
jgi:hypothetical protein